jgi:hypothetical protein
MDAALHRPVRESARDLCEDCRLRQGDDSLFTFHPEHIVARQHGGPDDESKLALACHHCNRRKGPNLAALDPNTNQMTRLFHPRRDDGEEHFRNVGAVITGRTPVGSAAARLLKMNASSRLDVRTELLGTGRWP